MNRTPMWRRHLRFLGNDVTADIEDEFQHHIKMRTRDLIARGMDPVAAQREAERRFGDMRQIRREVEGIDRTVVRRRARREWLAGLGLDIRHALRVLRRSPAFAIAAVLTLALGVGATSSLFSVVDALFLRPPPGVRGADQVVQLYVVRDEGNVRTSPEGGRGSYVDVKAIRAGAMGLSAVAGVLGPEEMDLGRGERAERIRGSAVSGNYFPLLGVRPQFGRFFLPEEDSIAGAHPVAVISDGFWRRHFGADRDVLGRSVLLNGRSITVVGVAERSFTGTEPDPTDVWVPSAMAGPVGLMSGGSEDWRDNPMMVAVGLLGRLSPGADPLQVTNDAAAALRHAAEATPSMDQTPGIVLGSLIPARGPHRSPAASLSLWLLAMAAVVLLIASANVASLLLARAASRRREIAVRLSLGAGRSRVVRHHLIESLLLALGGGIAGLLLAFLGSALIRNLPLPATAGETNLRVVAFAFAVAALSGILFGLVPAVRSIGVAPAEELKDRQAGGRPERGRMQRALVTIQVALSIVLLVGAGLFIRSVREVSRIDPGLAYDRLLVVSADFQRTGHSEAEQEAFYAAAGDRVRKIPGVRGTAVTHFTPFSGVSYGTELSIPGRERPGRSTTRLNFVGPDYFSVAGTPILRGRAITEDDRAGSLPVAIINEAMAKEIGGVGGSVVGECLRLYSPQAPEGCVRVVGIARNQRARILDDDVAPAVFLARAQAPEVLSWGGPALLVRTDGEPGEWAARVRSALQGLSPDLPYVAVQPVVERIRSDVLPYQLGATLFSLFGLLALLLAAIGLAGLLSHFVGERTAELGIRRALGALDRHVIRTVVRQGLVPVGIGLVVGMAGAWIGTPLLKAHLFGVSEHEPLVFVAVACALVAVALLAIYLPARRAASVDPAVALRAE